MQLFTIFNQIFTIFSKNFFLNFFAHKMLKKPPSKVFSLLPAQPKLPKQENSCSKMWLIDQLYIELGAKPSAYLFYIIPTKKVEKYQRQITMKNTLLDIWLTCDKIVGYDKILEVFPPKSF
jgi:hypothetical protein